MPHTRSVRLPDLPEDPGDALHEALDRLTTLVAHLADGSSPVQTELYAADCAVAEAWVDADGFAWHVSLTVDAVEDLLPSVWELTAWVDGVAPPPSPAAARWARHGFTASFVGWVGVLALPIVPALATRPAGDLVGIALVVGGVLAASVGAAITAGVVDRLAFPPLRRSTPDPVVVADWFAEVEAGVEEVTGLQGLPNPPEPHAQP